jgi:hypothetical protein
LRARSAFIAVWLTACGASSVEPVQEPVQSQPTLTLVSPQSIRVGEPYSISPDTLVFRVRDGAGRPFRGQVLGLDGTTGWLKSVTDSNWVRQGFQTFMTDSTGLLRLLWQASGAPNQVLSMETFGGGAPVRRTGSLLRPAIRLLADTVVSSGPDAVCIQQSGRVGCTGEGRCTACEGTPTISRMPGRIHWFRFASPVASITSTISGACALLADGNTACWNGVGPDSLATSDTGHPPFVELRGAVGRTASGAIWISPQADAYFSTVIAHPARRWITVPSDSVITALLENNNESAVCGRTRSDVVMCSSVRQSSNQPTFRALAMNVIRSLPDSAPVFATGGYTTQTYSSQSLRDRIVLRRGDNSTVSLSRFAYDTTAWLARADRDSTLSGPDPRVRDCVADLDAACNPASPWRSVSQSGRIFGVHISYESGFRRTCAVRSVIVCHSYLGRGYQQRSLSRVDTISLAP